MEVRRSILPPGTDQYAALLGWIDEVVPAGASLMEVGCGPGSDDYLDWASARFGSWFGVDPSPGVDQHPHLTGRHRGALEDWLADPPLRFDAALAVYVVEHVAAPHRFLRALRAHLDPGASAFLLTPNLWHYFGLTALAASRLGVEDRILHAVRGADLVEEYHFPVRYRMNSARAITRAAAGAGFSRVEVRHLDDPGVFAGYFPRRLGGVPPAWSRLVHQRRIGRLMGTLIIRLEA